MTWRELKSRLEEIPEEYLEKKALFSPELPDWDESINDAPGELFDEETGELDDGTEQEIDNLVIATFSDGKKSFFLTQ